jgi:hypothetical protein
MVAWRSNCRRCRAFVNLVHRWNVLYCLFRRLTKIPHINSGTSVVDSCSRMKSLLIAVLTLGLIIPSISLAKGHGSSHRSSRTSKKSMRSGSNDGSYRGGRGSSHKGGTYKNPKTNNHNRNRASGVPK